MKVSFMELGFAFGQRETEEPLVDLYETDDRLVCEADLPGIDPDQVEVKVFEDLLIIEGARAETAAPGRPHRYICMERYTDSFRRVIRIPVAVDPSGGRASYAAGVLTIIFPKTKERVIRIPVERQKGE